MIFQKIGIDLGTCNTRVAVLSKGIVVNEPSVIAMDKKRKEVVSFGRQALDMIGRAPDSVEAVRPLEHGAIINFVFAQALFNEILKLSLGSRFFFKPEAIISIPTSISTAQERAVIKVALQSGIKNSYLLKQSVCAALGLDISTNDPKGKMIAIIGGGVTEVSVISLGGIVVSESCKIGGNDINELLNIYFKKEHNINLGDSMTEELKITLTCAYLAPDEEEDLIEIRGRDLATGLPNYVQVTKKDLQNAINPALQTILKTIKLVLQSVPAELAGDIMDSGIILTGGSALLKGLANYISSEIKIPVSVADNPQESVIKGLLKALENFHRLKNYPIFHGYRF